jgi:hypothetical protein
MTTIVYRDGVLVADGRSCAGEWMLPNRPRKIVRLPDGTLATGSGEAVRIEAFMRWSRAMVFGLKSDSAPDMGDDARGILILPDGKVRVFEGNGWYDEDAAPFYAWGRGMPVALGALYMGATAEQAVEVACRVDPSSGGEIQVERLRRVSMSEAAE